MKIPLSTTTRRKIVITYDLIAIGAAFVGSFLLRFDFRIPPEMMDVLKSGLLWIYLIQTTVFVSQGLYRGLWSFASVKDLYLIVRAVLFSVALSVTLIAFFGNHLLGWPRSVFILDAILLVLILGGGRFAYRFGREYLWSIRQKRKSILIIGCGQSANLIARELSSRPELHAQPIGFLDDNSQLKKTRIHGATVLGPIDSLPDWLYKLRPDEVIIAIPSLTGSRVKQILNSCRDAKIPCRICPPIRDVLLGHVELNQLREVHVEDLLRREVVKVDDAALAESLQGRTILVTGAGGSIGSELCRQVLRYNPKTLLLFDQSEFNLYRFEQEFRRNSTDQTIQTELKFIIGDILDERRVRGVMSEYQPEVVLHAAAYKHVPLMEDNISEALRNNVLGTFQLASMARESGVKTFVFVSTDKAVRPTNVMGATKRMAELVAQAASKGSDMRSIAVRFGNVLNSEGSVLPLFRDQISRGGPVTVTHPEVTRFFMTIPEASQLVLQASLLGSGGEVFLLDMGEPVRIRELAEDLIRLSGLKPYEEIDIVFTGLRKGEKLYEELLFDMNQARKTTHPKIVVSTNEHAGAHLPENWPETLDRFSKAKELPSEAVLLSWIELWVPEFKRNPAQLQMTEEELEPTSPTLH